MSEIIDSIEENREKASVRAVGVKFGLYSTAFGIVFFLVLALSGLNAFDQKLNWINLVVGIVILVLAHKNFKDTGDGFMSYGQGIGIAFWSALISVIVGGLFVYVYSSFIDVTVLDKMYEVQRAEMESKNMPDEQIDVAMEWTQKLFWPMYFIIGMLGSMFIALIVTIFTHKKNKQASPF